MAQNDSLSFDAGVRATPTRHRELKERRIRQRYPEVRQLNLAVKTIFKVFDSLLSNVRLKSRREHPGRNDEDRNDAQQAHCCCDQPSFSPR